MMQKKRIEEQMSQILRAGILLSLGCMVLGLVLYLISQPQELIASQVEWFHMLDYVRQHGLFDPITVMLLGCFLLIVTPIFRVVSTFMVFVAEKDRLYIRFTAWVLVIIVISIVLGFIVEPK